VVVVSPPLASAPAPTAPAATSLAPISVKAATHHLTVIHGELVDLGTMTSLRTLTTDLVFSHAIVGSTAFLWVGGNELRAYDTKTGVQRWSRPSSASTIVAVGSRLLVAHDKTVEAFDENGALLGSTTAPVPADRGYTHASLLVAGSLACGAQRSDAATAVFCVDSTPRVVWSKSVPVSGGLLRQADAGALVVTSDSWAKSVSSEILRPSDGTTLLHSSVRLAAALTTGGVLDGALSGEPAVTLYDAKGAPKWTWTGPPFHRDALRAVRNGSNLVIALYSPIATGTQLVALDAASGSLTWQGNVDQLPIAHSKYSNEVELRDRGTSVVLVGRESSQDYAQTFDAATGKRLASILRGR
jgi:outer membrane protein assembly factor BamB